MRDDSEDTVDGEDDTEILAPPELEPALSVGVGEVFEVAEEIGPSILIGSVGSDTAEAEAPVGPSILRGSADG